MRRLILLLLLFVPFILVAQEYTVGTIPNPKTADMYNYVSNPDGILDSATVAELNTMLASLEADTHAEIAIVAVNSIGNEDIDHFAVELFEEWGVGKKKIDNGLLILFVLDQRAITFEVGYGLEGVITDGLSKRIQMQAMLPYFKEGDYGTGLVEGVKRVNSLIREEPVPEYEEDSGSSWKESWPILAALFIAWMLIAILLTALVAYKVGHNSKITNNHDRYVAMRRNSAFVYVTLAFIPIIAMFLCIFLFAWVYSSLFFFFPIALFPAARIGKKIQKRFRTRPIPCDECGGMMRLIPEDEDNKYLSPSQDFEEKIGSVDHDVFLCDNCHNIKIYSYNEANSPYLVCSNCGTRALKKQRSKVVKAATYKNTGIKRTIYRCGFCRHEESRDEVIPIKERSSGAVVGGFGGGGGGSSRSSGGSFGGGRSGGGGATSRW